MRQTVYRLTWRRLTHSRHQTAHRHLNSGFNIIAVLLRFEQIITQLFDGSQSINVGQEIGARSDT